MTSTNQSNQVRKPKNKSNLLNRFLHRLFTLLALISFALTIMITDSSGTLWKPLLYCFMSFLVFSFLGWYFASPKKAIRTIATYIYNIIVWFEFTISELKYRRKVNNIIQERRWNGTTWEDIYDTMVKQGM